MTPVEQSRSVLGAILVAPEILHDVREVLTAGEQLPTESLGELYDLQLRLADRGLSPDVTTVLAEATRTGALERIGGASTLSELTDCPDLANPRWMAEQVFEAHSRRRAERAGLALVERARDASLSLADTLDSAQGDLIAITTAREARRRVSVADVAALAVDEAVRLGRGELESLGLPTGFQALDRALAGLRPGRVYVAAGTTSSGKTAFALQVADLAVASGRSVVFASYEMDAREIAERILARRCRVALELFSNGNLHESGTVRRLAVEVENLRAGGLEVMEAAGATLAEVRAAARRRQARHGLDLVVIDYLQLVPPSAEARRLPREQQVAGLSRSAKELAVGLRVPVVVLSQLSRRHETEKRPPELHDLRESGAIEQDAHAVLMLHRPDRESRECELLIRKNRGGPLGGGPIRLRFYGEFQEFREVPGPNSTPPGRGKEAASGGDPWTQ